MCVYCRLTHEQVLICQYRHLLLSYLDRLSTYEVKLPFFLQSIHGATMYMYTPQVSLGGMRAADEKFSCSVFEELRSANLVRSAVEYARVSCVLLLYQDEGLIRACISHCMLCEL